MMVTEAKKILAVMMMTYPNYKPAGDIDAVAATWADMLSEYTYSQVDRALKAYILSDKSGFAPSIGQIVDKIQIIDQPQYLNEMEAWALVSKALRNSTYHSVEEYSKLPPLVQKAIGLPDNLRTWAMEENMNVDVVSSNFKSAYLRLVNRDQEISKMPSQIRSLIEKANKNSDSDKIEQGRRQAIENFRERERIGKFLETKTEGVEMPEKARKRKEELFGEECGNDKQ